MTTTKPVGLKRADYNRARDLLRFHRNKLSETEDDACLNVIDVWECGGRIDDEEVNLVAAAWDHVTR